MASVARVSRAETDSMQLYLDELGQHPLLTREREVELAAQIAAGKVVDPDPRQHALNLARAESAREIFIVSNLRLVISIARRYKGHGLDLPDLIQEGNIGLMRAIEKFDGTMGNKLSTYATWWIRQSILRAIADKGRSVRLPVHVYDDIGVLNRIELALEMELHRPPTVAELAKEMDQTTERVAFLLELRQQADSLDEPVYGDDTSRTGYDLLADTDGSPSTDAIIANLFDRDTVEHLLSCLSPRERQIIRLRYGLDGGTRLSLDRIGMIMGVKGERIRQLQANAERRMLHFGRVTLGQAALTP